MKLYYAPGACSLSDRISLKEAGLDANFEKVDLKAKKTETGANFLEIAPKGYVPVLVLDDGSVITENIAVLSWIADQATKLSPPGPLGRIRLLEALAYISTELHKGFKPFFKNAGGDEKQAARQALSSRYQLLADGMAGPYLFGQNITVADAYLFVTLRWARVFGVTVPAALSDYFELMMTRDSVRESLAEEGLEEKVAKRVSA